MKLSNRHAVDPTVPQYSCMSGSKKKAFRFSLFFTGLSERDERTQEFSHFFACSRIWKEFGRRKYDGI